MLQGKHGVLTAEKTHMLTMVFIIVVCWIPVCVCTQVSTFTTDMCSSQILWTFSIYLESVAIMPQLYMISKTGEAETITSHYLFALGLYRGLYIVNWVWRYYTEGFYDWISIVAGCVQTLLYCDFFYLYITKGLLQMRAN